MRNQFLIGLLLLMSSVPTWALIEETKDLTHCLTLAEQRTRSLRSNEILYVFDIDNTVLALKTNFGSVQWFRWQRSLINQNLTEDRVADTVERLLEIQSWIYQISPTYTPEATTSARLRALQTSGHPVIFHTSRSIDTYDLTERELTRNGLLPLQAPPPSFADRITYSSLPAEQRPVVFRNGAYLTAGQDKGVWLKALLAKLKVSPKHLVFVDDELKNLENVSRAFTAEETTLCRYSKLDGLVNDFNQSDKSTEIKLWQDLKDLAIQIGALQGHSFSLPVK